MAEKSWQLGRQQNPPALHFIVTPPHTKIRDNFIAELVASIRQVEEGPEACEGIAAMYAMMGTMCDQTDLKTFTLDYLDKTYR